MNIFSKKTFTLIEMLIVIVIIGILAAALVPRLQSMQARSRNSARNVHVLAMQNGLRVYALDRSSYPAHLGLLITNGYMTSIPSDPSVATNNSCLGVHGNSQYYDYSKGFFTGFPSCAGDNSASANCIGYQGFLYSRSNTYKTAFLATMMENDNSVNAHTDISTSSCTYIVSSWLETEQAWRDMQRTTSEAPVSRKGGLYKTFLEIK